jgi:hypothetical protein
MYQYTGIQEDSHFFYCTGRAYLELLASDIHNKDITYYDTYAVLRLPHLNGFSFKKQSRYYLYFRNSKIDKKYLLEEWDGEDYVPVYQEIEYYNELPNVEKIKNKSMIKYLNEEYRTPTEPDSDQFYNDRGELTFPWDSNSDEDYKSASSTPSDSLSEHEEDDYDEFAECCQDLGHGQLYI